MHENPNTQPNQENIESKSISHDTTLPIEIPKPVQEIPHTTKDEQGIAAIREKLGLSAEKPKRLHATELPLTTMGKFVLEKNQRGEPLTVSEAINAGRDEVFTGESVPGMIIKPDHAYRCVNEATYQEYLKEGSVEGHRETPDIHIHGKDNNGVDWYLGGFSLRYGKYVLETPADSGSFTLAERDGHMMAKDPYVRHIKSEGGTEKSIPMSMVEAYKIDTDAEGKVSAHKIK
jgi:hypothetical protein